MIDVDPEVWRRSDVRRALAEHDICTVYRVLTEQGVSQRRIADAVGQSQSEVSEIRKGRRVESYALLTRMADGLGVPRGWLGLAHTVPPSQPGMVMEWTFTMPFPPGRRARLRQVGLS